MRSIQETWLQSVPVELLENEVRRHNELYFIHHHPEISDSDFDRLVERLKEIRPDSPVLAEIGSDLRKGVQVPKINHSEPMLSLDKCYDIQSLMDWAHKFSGEVLVMPKIDGCAIAIRYDENGKLALAATRGDGVKGEDITANVFWIRGIQPRISEPNLEIRGEVYQPLSVFEKFKENFSNPRNLAAGAIKQKVSHKTKDYSLQFFAYDIFGRAFKTQSEKMVFLQDLGFQPVEWKILSQDSEALQKLWENYLQRRSELDYEIDGIVLKADSIAEQRRLGASAHHPRSAIAYKFQGDFGVTTLKAIDWNVARTGVITPMGLLEPVKLSGAMVSRTSLHNYGLLQKLNLKLPAKVLMVRRGGVIPHLEEVLEIGTEPVNPPESCPECGSPVEIQDDFLYCSNRSRCQKVHLAELEHFVKTLEIDGFGGKLLERLYEKGLLQDGADFFKLTEADLLPLERMGETLAKKLIQNIQSRRQISLELFLQALGIRELAKHASKILANDFGSLEKILLLTSDDLSQIHTFGPVMAREIYQGLQHKRPLIEKLLASIQLIEKTISLQSGKLSSKRFLFTGKMASFDRKQAKAQVQRLGGQIASGVSQELDYLVVGDEGYQNREKGNKWIKAEKLIKRGAALQIISEKEFLKMVEDYGF